MTATEMMTPLTALTIGVKYDNPYMEQKIFSFTPCTVNLMIAQMNTEMFQKRNKY